jgi:hypothetical protein
MKSFIIARKRVVAQICTDEYHADSEDAAIALANTDQGNKKDDGFSWQTLDEVIEYSTVTEKDITHVEDIKERKTIYVVGFDPVDDKAGVGGFDWFYDRKNAIRRMNEHLQDDTYYAWFRIYEAETTGRVAEDHVRITNDIQNNIILYGSYGEWQ